MNGASLGEARIRAELETVCLIRAIERLELKVSASKTEVVAFMSEKEHVPGLMPLRLEGVGNSPCTGTNTELVIDLPGSLSPSPPERIAAALAHIMVKIGETYIRDSSPIDHYVWGPDLDATVIQDRIIMRNVVKLQRHLALKVFHGY